MFSQLIITCYQLQPKEPTFVQCSPVLYCSILPSSNKAVVWSTHNGVAEWDAGRRGIYRISVNTSALIVCKASASWVGLGLRLI